VDGRRDDLIEDAAGHDEVSWSDVQSNPSENLTHPEDPAGIGL